MAWLCRLIYRFVHTILVFALHTLLSFLYFCKLLIPFLFHKIFGL